MVVVRATEVFVFFFFPDARHVACCMTLPDLSSHYKGTKHCMLAGEGQERIQYSFCSAIVMRITRQSSNSGFPGHHSLVYNIVTIIIVIRHYWMWIRKQLCWNRPVALRYHISTSMPAPVPSNFWTNWRIFIKFDRTSYNCKQPRPRTCALSRSNTSAGSINAVFATERTYDTRI